MSKTGIAGMGILPVVLFATVLPPRESVGMVLVVLIVGDIIAVGTYRREASWPDLFRLFPWAAAGVVIGWAIFGRINDAMLKPVIGMIVVGLTLFTIARQVANLGGDGEGLSKRPWLVALVGLSAGITTMVANAAGPIMTLYLLGQRLPKRLFVGTAAWYFLVLNLFKVPFSAQLGLINPATLGIALWLIPGAIIGGLIGRVVLDKIDQQLFERLALGLTLIAGIRLLL
jgi:uncharacterized membrane protein YfcA